MAWTKPEVASRRGADFDVPRPPLDIPPTVPTTSLHACGQLQCLDEIQQQYDALMAEGILLSSMPSPEPAGSHAPGMGPGVVSPATAPGTIGGAHGEADADLELDEDGGGGGAIRYRAL